MSNTTCGVAIYSLHKMALIENYRVEMYVYSLPLAFLIYNHSKNIPSAQILQPTGEYIGSSLVLKLFRIS